MKVQKNNKKINKTLKEKDSVAKLHMTKVFSNLLKNQYNKNKIRK
jgi:hypothetical protein